MTALELMKLEGQLANVRAARIGNQIKVAELSERIEQLQKDIQISLDKEAELEQTIKNGKGT